MIFDHLSETLHSFQRIKMCPYGINDIILKIFLSNMEYMGIFRFPIEHNSLIIRYCIQCYSVPSLHSLFFVNGINLYYILD